MVNNALLSHGSEIYVLALLITGKIKLEDIRLYGGKRLFADPRNLIIYNILDDKNITSLIDPSMVESILSDEMLIDEAGGVEYIQDVVSTFAVAEYLDSHIKILIDYSAKRDIRNVITTGVDKLYKLSPDQTISDINCMLQNIDTGTRVDNIQHIKAVLSKTMDHIESCKKNNGVNGIKTGFVDLDKMITGLAPGELTIIAGRPGMGKSAFAFQLAYNAAQDHKILFLTLEMTDVNCCLRLISGVCRVEFGRIKSGMLSKRELVSIAMGVENIHNRNLYTDDTANQSVLSIRKILSKEKYDCIVIDYLQIMTVDQKTESRTQDISNITRSLKLISKEFGLHVIALSQLSRASETRQGSKRPQLSDLRESGSIEQDADTVIFVHRNFKYSFDETEKNKAELIISKQRNGACGILDYIFDEEYVSFSDVIKTCEGGQDENIF